MDIEDDQGLRLQHSGDVIDWLMVDVIDWLLLDLEDDVSSIQLMWLIDGLYLCGYG